MRSSSSFITFLDGYLKCCFLHFQIFDSISSGGKNLGNTIFYSTVLTGYLCGTYMVPMRYFE